MPATVSRHSSHMSIDTVSTVLDDACSDASESTPTPIALPKTPVTPGPSASAARRTRQRFTSEQLADLEALYHACSHPPRECREELAGKHELSLRCVTIWFQNKRQIERRTASHVSQLLLATPPSASTIYSKPARRGGGSPPRSPVSPSSTLVSLSSPARAPIARTASLPHRSLDAVAAMPRTPRVRPTLGRAQTLPDGLWARMPGSPSESTRSPERARGYVECGRGTRTLEWACAAARLSSLDGDAEETDEDEPDLDMDELRRSSAMFDDADAATLPPSSPALAGTDAVAGPRSSAAAARDEDTLSAAWVLCGMGRK